MREVARFPKFRSDRLTGLEVELDASFTAPVHTVDVPGWSRKSDASLKRGYEYVLEPAVKFDDVRPAVKEFSRAAGAARLSAGRSGSVHVHVQGHGLTTRALYSLWQFYGRYADEIACLVPPSRRANYFCATPDTSLTFEKFETLVKPLCTTRAAARRSAVRYRAVNVNMMRVEDPSARSIEFRQGAASTRFASIYGWAAFCTALTEMAATDSISELDARNTESSKKWDGFLGFFERLDPQLAEWCEWRRWYLYREPTKDDLDRVLSALASGKTRGLFTISSVASLSHNVAKKALDILKERRVVEGTQVSVLHGSVEVTSEKYAVKTMPVDATVQRYYQLLTSRKPKPAAVELA